jgi:hypothetical protein
VQDSPGNIAIRDELLESIPIEYRDAPYGLKVNMHAHVVRLVKERTSARFFLKQHKDGGWWEEVPEDTAIEKGGSRVPNLPCELDKKRKYNSCTPGTDE